MGLHGIGKRGRCCTPVNPNIPEPWIGAGMGKEYTISCIDSDVLQAMVDKDDMPICAVAQACGLSRCVLTVNGIKGLDF